MEKKILTARLKDMPNIAVDLPVRDFSENWLVASTVIEGAKRQMLHKLKNELHEKIAVLDLDDIEFKII